MSSLLKKGKVRDQAQIDAKARLDPILATKPEKSQVGCNFGQLVRTFRFFKAISAVKKSYLAPGCRIR